ncbi:MAG: hypothetical protein RQ758_02690 [Methanomicrobiaceae archaeon]|nr:hypothetical protein [Methanomicrobiaceae archaeon]
MAINEAQVDQMISTASADDPEVRMQQLQEEVELIKKSIKKLLIDIRERVNELENPVYVPREQPTPQRREEGEKRTEAPLPASPPQEPAPLPQAPPVMQVPYLPQPLPPVPAAEMRAESTSDERLLLALQQKLGERAKREEPARDKLRLQKVHRLFDWTSRTVKKYGHDRLEIMLDSYRVMGYISPDACAQVKEIARLMPESIGESHEIGSDEFVTELYGLNRILDPSDSSLDSDMIEVLMEQKKRPGEASDMTGREKRTEEHWADMLDRI